MMKSLALTALAALTLVGTPVSGASAADLDDYSTTRRYDAPRPVDRNYDEDDYDNRYERGRYDRGGYGRHGGWGHHHMRTIEARASYASDYLPYHVKEWRARRSAIEAWRGKVETMYGPRFSHWRNAMDKRVNCDAGAGAVYCTVSGRPVRGTGSRWGWYGNSRNY